MIRLDIDLSYLTKNFEIGTQRLNQYGSKSIDEIMEAEAEQGNPRAEKFEQEVLNDPKQLLKLFKLSNARNRYAILSNMNSADLEYIMQFLEPNDLLMGLMFFTKEKLMDLIYKLPKDKICSIVFQAFSMEQFLKLIPEKEIDKFFDSYKLDKDKLLEFVKSLPEEKLNQMVEKYMFQEEGKIQEDNNWSAEHVVNWMNQLDPDKFKKALKCFEREEKSELITELTKQDQNLRTEFSKNALTFPLRQLDKQDIVKNMNKLEPADLVKMINELPDELLSVVATQIDPEVFAEILSKNFKDILSEIGIGNVA